MSALHAGWYLVAFADELSDDLTPVRVGGRRMMLVRRESGLRLVDSTCPHRGADLAYGGVLKGNAVLCPFHGRRIAIGASRSPYSVREYPTFVAGPLVFARLTAQAEGDCGFPALVSAMLEGHEIRTAVSTSVDVPVDYVVENAFDAEHFSVVHGVPSVRGMTASTHPEGYLTVDATFLTLQDPWQDPALRDYLRVTLGPGARRMANTASGFHATAFSPTLVATVFGSGAGSSVILTGAVPTPEGTRVRVAVSGHPGAALDRVVDGAIKAIEQDVDVWAHLDPDAPSMLDELDGPVIAFQEFCRAFPAAPLIPLPTAADSTCPAELSLSGVGHGG